jgi:hypothetical protein
MTSHSEHTVLPTTDVPTAPNVLPIKRRGRPTGVKNGDGVTHKKPAVKKKPVKKPRINVDAIVANSELKKAKEDILHLVIELETMRKDFNAAKLHIEKVEKQHKAALIVVGYLEGKVFNE